MRSVGAMLLLAVMWGLSIPVTKLGLATMPPLTLTVLRFAIAVLSLSGDILGNPLRVIKFCERNVQERANHVVARSGQKVGDIRSCFVSYIDRRRNFLHVCVQFQHRVSGLFKQVTESRRGGLQEILSRRLRAGFLPLSQLIF